jgi:UDP-glucose 4-epimerase
MFADEQFASKIAPLVGNQYCGRKVLVAGGNGFLGANCVEALLALGAKVSIITRKISIPRHGCLSVFDGDARNPTLLRAAVEQQEFVFDFLGGPAAVASNQSPLTSLEGELRAHLALFEACANAPSSPVVMFCSSRLVYGKPEYLPVDESHPLRPQSFYAINKIAAEQYLKLFANSKELRYCVLRVSNPYGPNQPNETKGYGIINSFLSAAANGKEIVVYGDGGQMRDYVHVSDVMIAFLSSAVNKSCYGKIYNFGGHTVARLRDVVSLIAELAGGTPVRFEPWPSDYRSVETGDYASDQGRISSTLNLPPQVSQRDGFASTLLAYRLRVQHAGATPTGNYTQAVML